MVIKTPYPLGSKVSLIDRALAIRVLTEAFVPVVFEDGEDGFLGLKKQTGEKSLTLAALRTVLPELLVLEKDAESFFDDLKERLPEDGEAFVGIRNGKVVIAENSEGLSKPFRIAPSEGADRRQFASFVLTYGGKNEKVLALQAVMRAEGVYPPRASRWVEMKLGENPSFRPLFREAWRAFLRHRAEEKLAEYLINISQVSVSERLKALLEELATSDAELEGVAEAVSYVIGGKIKGVVSPVDVVKKFCYRAKEIFGGCDVESYVRAIGLTAMPPDLRERFKAFQP